MIYSNKIDGLIHRLTSEQGITDPFESSQTLIFFYQDWLNIQISEILSGHYLDADFNATFETCSTQVKNVLKNYSGTSQIASLCARIGQLVSCNTKTMSEFLSELKADKSTHIMLRINDWIDKTHRDAIDILSATSELNNDATKFQIETFITNIKVAALDHHFVASVTVLELLNIHKSNIPRYIEGFEKPHIFSIKSETKSLFEFLARLLLSKIDYLIGLLGKRMKEEGNSYSFFDGSIHQESSVVPSFQYNELKSLFQANDVILPDESISINHKHSSARDIIESFLKGGELSLFQFRLLARLISSSKNIGISYADLIARFLVIKSKIQNHIEYDQYVMNLVHLYLLNSRLSYEIKMGYTIEQIKSSINEIKRLSIQYGIRNYFPAMKVCVKLIDDYNAVLTKKFLGEEYLDSLDLILCAYKEYLDELEISLNWSETKKFVPFRETQKACTITIKDNNADGLEHELFIASSFSTPLNYTVIRNNVDGLRSLSTIMVQQFQNARNLLQYRNEVNELKTGLESSQKRQIEILSIFAAIVLFVSGNIQLFKEVDSVAQGLHFMLIFSLALSLFVSLIWVVFRDPRQKIRDKQWMILVFYFIVFIVAIFTLPLANAYNMPKYIFIHLFPF